MKLFISWSGERSQALASILHERLPYILQYLEPWLSQSDIEAGDRWADKVAKELEESTFGITCLTAENASAPWLLFEAGALAKSMSDGRVIPLLLDLNISDISGPLAQFQAKKADRPGILEVVQSINRAAPSPLADNRIKPLLDALWPDFEKAISEIPKSQTPTKKTRDQREILEELVDSVRSLDIRYRETIEESSSRRTRFRYHPMMVDEIMHGLPEDPRDPVRILIISSMLREEFPWVYDLGMEAYRALKSNRLKEGRAAHRQFVRAIEMLTRGPFPLDDMGLDKRTYRMLRDARHLINIDLSDIDNEERKAVKPRPSRKPPT